MPLTLDVTGLGLKVRTVVSLHVWDLIRGPRPG